MKTVKVLFLLATQAVLVFGLEVIITPSLPEPAPVGQMITWHAATDREGDFRFRFRYRNLVNNSSNLTRRRDASRFQIVRDFSPTPILDWTASDQEGIYEVEITAQDTETGETATSVLAYRFVSRLTGQASVVTATEHPLVFLFSAPPCPAGAKMHIEFQTGEEAVQRTPQKLCQPGSTANFYLAGMRGDTEYRAWSVTEADGRTEADPVLFTTGTPPDLSWTQAPLTDVPEGSSQPVLLGTSGGSQIAHDLQGRMIWYNPAPFTWATRPEAGGFLWGVMEYGNLGPAFQTLRAVDLRGTTVLETNAARVSEQLEAMGHRHISAFHHEVRPISGGRIVALAGVEQIMQGVQGSGETNILGDMVVVLDRDLNVVWAWDAFEQLDVHRGSTSDDICTGVSSGCPPFFLSDEANDWTHSNSIQETPDGDLLVSVRHQDWVIRIDYRHGAGTGAIVWRLGKDGDFTWLSDDAYPWFSHQHDANFELGEPNRMVVFDNGNMRQFAGDTWFSRAQVIDLDPDTRTAELVMNVDLGVLALAVGSAQRLDNGNYHFNAGFVSEGGRFYAYGFEIDPGGEIVFRIRANTGLYRTFRMRDMYSGAEF